jgi:ELWxxDGT repeat protein
MKVDSFLLKVYICLINYVAIKLMKKLFTLLLALSSYLASAQISFFKELNAEEDGSYPFNFIEINGTTFFITTELSTYRLWKTDGTESGTVPVTDQPIVANPFSFRDANLYSFNNELYYFVQDISVSATISLWKTNGSEKTLVLANADFIGKLCFFNNEIYYTIHGGLYKISNGESILVKSLPANTSLAYNHPMTIVNNQLVFFTIMNSSGSDNVFQVWESDGNTSGTSIIHSISNYSEFSMRGNQSYIFGNTLCFFIKRFIIAPDNSSIKTVIELWKTDGSQTLFVKNILENNYHNSSAQTSSLGNFKNNLIFILNNKELWIYDTTTDSTSRLRTFTHFPDDPSFNKKWGILDSKFYFSAFENNDYELWESDGTISGTFLSKDINTNGSSNPYFFTKIDNKLFFKANLNEVWQADGTEAGTFLLLTLPISPAETVVLSQEFFYTSSNQLLFNNYDPQHHYELWTADVTLQNKALLKNIVTYSQGSLASDKKLKLGNTWFFNGRDHRGGELWKTDGTEAGTVLVKDINPGYLSALIQEIVAVGNTIYFTVRFTNENYNRLFKSDGTENGTVEIILSSETQFSVNPQKLVATIDKIFFWGNTSYKLWVSDGTPIGTHPIQAAPAQSARTNTLTALGNKVFFDSDGQSLWVSDGTETGTYKIFTPYDDKRPLNPTCLIEFKNKLYFLSNYFMDFNVYSALFESDGTVAGTKIIKDFAQNVYLLSDTYLFLQKTDNQLFFRAVHSSSYPNYFFNLWTSDGTTQGTQQLKTINFDRSPDLSFASVNNQFYIFLNPNSLGTDLTVWTSDGTVDGTIEISKKIANYRVRSTINFHGKLFYSYYEKEHGTELFKINQANTEVSLAGEIINGSKNSNIYNLMDFPDKILFWGTDETHGSEMWQYLPMDCEGNLNYTKQSGSWDSTDTWTCGRVPNFGDIVLIKSEHSVSVPNNFNAQAKSLTTQPGAVLDIPKSSILLVKP